MNIEDYMRLSMASMQLSMRDTAMLMGIKEQSLRNKFSRHSFSVRDIVAFATIINRKLEIVDTDTDEPPFTFKADDYLSKEEINAIHNFKTKNITSQDFLEWYNSQPEEQRLSIAESIERTRQDVRRSLTIEKYPQGYTIVPKFHFRDFVIIGENHTQAAEWIMEQLIDSDMAKEIQCRSEAEKKFDVIIWSTDGLPDLPPEITFS